MWPPGSGLRHCGEDRGSRGKDQGERLILRLAPSNHKASSLSSPCPTHGNFSSLRWRGAPRKSVWRSSLISCFGSVMPLASLLCRRLLCGEQNAMLLACSPWSSSRAWSRTPTPSTGCLTESSTSGRASPSRWDTEGRSSALKEVETLNFAYNLDYRQKKRGYYFKNINRCVFSGPRGWGSLWGSVWWGICWRS